MKHEELIKNHPRLKLIIKLALATKVLKYSPQAMEKEPVEEGSSEMRREGYYAEDITGFWMPDSFQTYVKGNLENFKQGFDELGLKFAFSMLSLKLPWSGWSFVVDAKKTIPHDIVSERLAEARQKKQKKLPAYEHLITQITPEEVENYLKTNYQQISPAVWVSPHDPSCFIYDEKYKPFQYKDGWSTEQIGEIMAEWFEALTGHKVKPQYVSDAPW